MKLLKAFTLTSMAVAGGQSENADISEPKEVDRRFLVSLKNKRIIFFLAKLLVTLI